MGNRQELVIYGGKPSEISYLRWGTVSSGQAGSGSTDSGPHEPSWSDFRRTIYIYIANVVCGEIRALRAPLELELELAL